MPNITISGLPLATLPLDGANSFFEVQTVEAGVTVSRKVASDDINVASAIVIEDEGTPLTGGADTLNFVGPNVVASGAGSTKTITISGGGVVDSVIGGTNINVDAGDPINPIVNLDAAITGVSVNGVTLSNAGGAGDFLNEQGNYVAAGGAVDSVFTRTGAVTAEVGDYSAHYLVKTGGPQTCVSDVTINGGGGLIIDDPTINLRLENSTDLLLLSSGNSENARFSLTASLMQVTGSGFNPPDLSLQIQNWVGLDVNVQSYFQPSVTVGGNSNPGSGASINIPHGAVPSTPLDGDVWTTTSGYFARINGVTIDLSGGGGAVTQLEDGAANPATVAEGLGITAIRSVGNTDGEGREVEWQNQNGTTRASLGTEFFTDFIMRNHLVGGSLIFRVGTGGGSRIRAHMSGDAANGGFSAYAGTSAVPMLQTHPWGVEVGNGTLFLVDQAAPEADITNQGQLWVNQADDQLNYIPETGTPQVLDPSLSEINDQDNDYTLLITDKGKTIRRTTNGFAETWTIPAEASVDYPIGTWVAFYNDGGNTTSIAITTDLMRGTDGFTGTRTLGDNQRALIQKVASALWVYQATDL